MWALAGAGVDVIGMAHIRGRLSGQRDETTMTMTHSDEITDKCQKPGPTDMGDGVMTPWKRICSTCMPCSASKEGS